MKMNVARLPRQNPAIHWLGSIAVIALMTLAGYSALILAPEERSMGLIQRIFYFHATSGMTAFVAFFICFIGNVLYIVKREPRWDWLAVSAAEGGGGFN